MSALVMPGDQLRERGHNFGDDFDQLDSGLYVPAELVVEHDYPIGVDLFCGAGGFSCGCHQAGFHIAVAAEWDIDSMCTYLCNLGGPDTVIHFLSDAPTKGKWKNRWKAGESFVAADVFPGAGTGWIASSLDHEPGSCASHIEDEEGRLSFCDAYHAEPVHRLGCEHFYFGDVCELTGAQILEDLELERGDIGVVFGGPPCQGFSMANPNAGPDDPRNLLVFEFARLVLELNPKAMMMENVPRLTTMLTAEGVPVVDALSRVLADGDWSTYAAVRKSLGGDTRGALRRDGAAAEADDDEDEEDSAQLDLFASA